LRELQTGRPCPKGPHYHRRFKHPVGTNLAIAELQRNYIALGMTLELETINTCAGHDEGAKSHRRNGASEGR